MLIDSAKEHVNGRSWENDRGAGRKALYILALALWTASFLQLNAMDIEEERSFRIHKMSRTNTSEAKSEDTEEPLSQQHLSQQHPSQQHTANRNRLLFGRDFAANNLPVHKIGLVIIYCLFGFLTGYSYWGWPALERMYKRAGIFESYCYGLPPSNSSTVAFAANSSTTAAPVMTNLSDCNERSIALSNMFTYASTAHAAAALLTGTVLHIKAAKATAYIGLLATFAGWLTVGLSTNYAFMAAAHMLIGSFAELLLNSIIHVGTLFKNPSKAIFAIGAARATSPYVPVILERIFSYFSPSSFRYIMLSYVALCLSLTFFITHEFIPIKPLKEEAPGLHGPAQDEPARTSAFRGFCQAIISPEYVLMTSSMILHSISCQYYMKAATRQLVSSDGSDATNLLNIFNGASALSTLVFLFVSHYLSSINIGILNGMFCFGLFSFLHWDAYTGKIISSFFFMLYVSSLDSNYYKFNLENRRNEPALAATLSNFGSGLAGVLSMVAMPIYNSALVNGFAIVNGSILRLTNIRKDASRHFCSTSGHIPLFCMQSPA